MKNAKKFHSPVTYTGRSSPVYVVKKEVAVGDRQMD